MSTSEPGSHGEDVDLDRLREVLIEVSLSLQDRYPDRQPTEEEVASFLRERLEAEGHSDEEIAAILEGG